MNPEDSRLHGSLAEQLAFARSRLFPTLTNVIPVSQICLMLKPRDPAAAFVLAQRQVLQWIAHRAGPRLPDGAWRGESFDLEEVGSQRVSAVALDEPRYWAVRLDDADRHVPQRVWTTETSFGCLPDGGVLLGTRLTCVTRGTGPEFERSVPGFVRQLVNTGEAILDERLLRSEPWVIDDESAVDDLVRLLSHPLRRVDVIVFALPEGSTNVRDTAIDAHAIHRATLGAAHVVVLTNRSTFELTNRIGKEFSVFRHAVRTYAPRFDCVHDQPFQHPLALPGRIANWRDGGAEGFARFLIQKALARSVAGPDLEERVPSFAAVRQASARRRREAAQALGVTDRELLELALDENKNLADDIAKRTDEYDSLVRLYERERDEALQARDELVDIVRNQRTRVELLEERVRARPGEQPEVPVPELLDDFEQWCRGTLAGAVVMLSRAYQGAKKSEYSDPSLIYKSLLLLRDKYVPMRRLGGADARRAYEEALSSLGLEDSQTLAGPNYEGDTYEVKFNGRRRLLERHLKRGKSREPRHCFRLYFFWDEEMEQAVVGWLPSHLQNRMT